MMTNIYKTLADGVNMEGMATMRRSCKLLFTASELARIFRADLAPVPEDGGMGLCPTDKVAGLVLYLCSEDGEIVNGAAWTADAGATAN